MNQVMNQKAEALKLLQSVLKNIRKLTPKEAAKDIKEADVDLSRFEVMDDKIVKRAVITLRSAGCAWCLSGGGCTMCGHLAGANKEEVTDADKLYSQFKNAFDKIDFSDYPVLCIYNGGSILNPAELPPDCLKKILTSVAGKPEIKMLSLESREEYISAELLSMISNILGKTKLRIAMGLESANEEVRTLSIHKGSSLKQFSKSCELIRKHALLRLYVLFKPPWLTETEMIDDAVNAVRLAKELGADDIHIEPVTIQKHTLVELLFNDKKYQLPWLWSVIEVLKRVAPIKVYISPFAHVPKPIVVPHNCDKCNDFVSRKILQNYNRSYDVSVFENLSCDCQKLWLDDLQLTDSRSLHQRIVDDLKSIDTIDAIDAIDTTDYNHN